MTVAPSGKQFELRHGNQRATVVEVGGGVREYFVGERAVLEPYPLEQMCDGAHGTVLVPWPNRQGGGRYRFDGQEYQVPLTDPGQDAAIHGLPHHHPSGDDDAAAPDVGLSVLPGRRRRVRLG